MKYILKLSDNRNIKKFYKNLWIYKSIFFYKTTFATEDDVDIQTRYIIECLNIKNRKERIINVYDRTCEIIDKKNEGSNICGFKDRVCKAHQCENKKKYLDGCCRMCLYKTPRGCPSKNVACKLFNCGAVKEKYEVYKYNDLSILKLLSLKNRVIVKHDYFSLREDVLKDLFSYSLIYSTIRMSCRMIKNVYLVKNKH